MATFSGIGGDATARVVRAGAVFVAVMLVGLVVSAAAQAAPGDLDTTFSGDGKQTTSFGDLDEATGVAVQEDGKIVVVGTSCCSRDFALARYNPGGSLDTSFSGDGKQTTSFGPGDDAAAAVALQGDGKIVVVGQNGAGDFALARYTSSGSLDPSFSGDGKRTTDFFGDLDGAAGVAVQGDGKIVVVGRARFGNPSYYDFALARYNPDGSFDTSFSGNGKQSTNFGEVSDDLATGVALQGNGKIVVVGSIEAPNAAGFSLARYNPNGSLDMTFSGNGKQRTGFDGDDGATGVALQVDGKIVAVGTTGRSGGGDFALARYTSSGSLDTSFSGNGTQTTHFGNGSGATAVALQGNGKIIAVGRAGEPDFSDTPDFALARYNPSGSLDSSFSGDGKQTTSFGGGDTAAGVALQGDGRIVVVGSTTNFTSFSRFALARYLGG